MDSCRNRSAGKARQKEGGGDSTNLGNVCTLESRLGCNSIPVNVSLVLGVLYNAEEKHGFGGGGLFLEIRHGDSQWW